MDEVIELFWQFLILPVTFWPPNLFCRYGGFDWFAWIVIVLLWALGLFLAFALLSWIARVTFYRFSYGPAKESEGKVTKMRYRSGYYTNTVVSTGRSTTVVPTYHPPTNNVTFETPQGTSTVDSEALYGLVKRGEKIKVKYQDRYAQPRFWQGEWEHDGYRLLRITDSQDDSVIFNKAKPVNTELPRTKQAG